MFWCRRHCRRSFDVFPAGDQRCQDQRPPRAFATDRQPPSPVPIQPRQLPEYAKVTNEEIMGLEAAVGEAFALKPK